MSYFNKIVNEWSHRVKSGMPDVNNFGHKLNETGKNDYTDLLCQIKEKF